MESKELKIIKKRGNEVILLTIGLIIIHKHHWKQKVKAFFHMAQMHHTVCIFLMLISNWIFLCNMEISFPSESGGF